MQLVSSIRRVTIALLVASAVVPASDIAAAENNTIGMTIKSDRDPDNLAAPKGMKYELSGDHEFANGVIVGGSFQYTDPAFSQSAIQNLEGTVGYGVPLNSAFSLNGSTGIGERWHQNPDTSFPYYVFRIAVDYEINQNITWNVVSFRLRNAFDSSDNYRTPQVATGLTFALGPRSSISVKVMRNWKEGELNSMGIALGFKKRF